MISSVDKAILGTVGVLLTGMTAAASSFAWSMMHATGGPVSGAPGAIVAQLSLTDGSVKTRHRETLAWSDGVVSQQLREGDRIRTLSGSRASVRYAQGLEVELDPNSQITVHGPVDAKGETLVAAIDVVDGSIRAKVESGKAVALRDAAGRDQGQLKSTSGSAEVALKAADQADGAIGLKVLPGNSVSVKIAEGAATTLTEGQEQRLGDQPTPTPTPTVAVAIATPVPPLEGGAPLPQMTFDNGDIRIRRALPPGVKAVEVRGQKAVLHEDGSFEIELFNQPSGVTTIDLVYFHTDGRVTRQPQRIRVQ